MPLTFKKSFFKKNKRVVATFGVLAALIVGLGSVTALANQGQDNRGWAATDTLGRFKTNSTDTSNTKKTKGTDTAGSKSPGSTGYAGAKANATTTTTTNAATSTSEPTTTTTTSTNTGASNSDSGSSGSNSKTSTSKKFEPKITVNGCIKSNGKPSKSDFLTVTWTNSPTKIQVVNISTDSDKWDASSGYFWNKDVRNSTATKLNIPSGKLTGQAGAQNKSLPARVGNYYGYLWDGSKAIDLGVVTLKGC